MVEGHIIDARENLENSRRLGEQENHDRGFHRRAADFHAGHFFNDHGRIGWKGEDRLHPVANPRR